MMKQKMLLLTLIAITLSSLASIVPGAKQGLVEARAVEVDAAAKEEVLKATVRITVHYQPTANTQLDGNQGQEILVTSSQALGTLVQDREKTYLVTHDHWSHLEKGLRKVQLSNAQGDVLVELERALFYGLIRYRDGGTMVLEAPEQLSSQLQSVEATWNDNEQLAQQGDELLMVHWRPEASEQVSVERVSVTLVEDHEGLSSMKLQSLSGQAVVQGNSGGGVFKNGRLVANMWSTMVVQQLNAGDAEETAETDMSRAAKVTFEEENSTDLQVETSRHAGLEM
jgi:hypothetical protein